MKQNRKIHLGWPILLAGLIFARRELAQAPGDRLVEVDSITVKGTHLSSESIIRLAGIKLHDQVDDLIVNTACHKITATGLVKKVDYAYDAYPDRAGVTLNLSLTDEGPLLPATIKPAADENILWSSLQALDPIFTRELPPTEKALAFYSRNIEKCLQMSGRSNEYAGSNVTADARGKLTGIIFEIRRYKTLPTRK